MNPKTKKKLCWNCEGSTSVQDENCPYCGVYLSPLSIGGNEDKEDSLFAPPYRLSNIDEEQEVPLSPFALENEGENESSQTGVSSEKVQVITSISKNQLSESTRQMQAITMPLVLLLTGSIFLLFGIVLVLFSQNGVFTLHWDANYWFIYLGISVPLLFFGWRALHHLDAGLKE